MGDLNERSTRVFRKISTLPTTIFVGIKSEVKLWPIARAKHLMYMMSGELFVVVWPRLFFLCIYSSILISENDKPFAVV